MSIRFVYGDLSSTKIGVPYPTLYFSKYPNQNRLILLLQTPYQFRSSSRVVAGHLVLVFLSAAFLLSGLTTVHS